MAKIKKTLKIKNSSDVVESCCIYDSLNDIDNNHLSLEVDGKNVYVPLVSITDGLASSGRVKKNNNTYAIGRANRGLYNKSSIFIEDGVFIVPDDVYRLRVTCVGGGAGGCDFCFMPPSWINTTNVPEGTTQSLDIGNGGGDTIFGDKNNPFVIASGATGVKYTATNNNGTITCEITDGISHGETDGTYAYNKGGYFAGATGTIIYNVNGEIVGVAGVIQSGYYGNQLMYGNIYGYGAGGGVDNVRDNSSAPESCGGSGYVVTKYINVTPGQKIPYTVGKGGKAFYKKNLYENGMYEEGSPSGGCERGCFGAVFVEWGSEIYNPNIVLYDNKLLIDRTTKIDKNGNVTTEQPYFIVPDNVYTLRVTCVGGGAGGVTGCTSNDCVSGVEYDFGNGGYPSMFGPVPSTNEKVIANGGTSCKVTYTNGSVTSYVVSKGTVDGTYHYGSTGSHHSSGYVPIYDINAIEHTDTKCQTNGYDSGHIHADTKTKVVGIGVGGYCDENNGGRVNFTGASGYITTNILQVKPGDKIPYSVGERGGAWGRNGLKWHEENVLGYGFCPGCQGAILVEWGGCINDLSVFNNNYNNKIFETSGTFSVPENVYTIGVTCVGGGAGAFNCLRSDIKADKVLYCSNSDGGDTTFQHTTDSSIKIVAAGATGIKVSWRNYNLGTGYNLGKEDSGDIGEAGGAGYKIIGNNQVNYGSYGTGGSVQGRGAGEGLDISGASGCFTRKLLNVKPGDTFDVKIGAGGAACMWNDYGNDKPSNGENGVVFIEWGELIKK